MPALPLIPRPQLIRRIRPYYADGLVKVITGMRRTGKSSLLRLIAEDMAVELHRPADAFAFFNFEDLELRGLRDPLRLHERILSLAKEAPSRLTIFLDEIENVEEWETCINSLRSRDVCDIFITGSNSRLLSGELATHLAGRTIQFDVLPFSFAEFMAARRCRLAGRPEAETARERLWREYLQWGGMPGIVQYENLADAALYLHDTFQAILWRDVAERLKPRQPSLLGSLFAYLLDQAGHRISMANIEKFLKAEKLSASRETLLDYAECGVQAFMFHRVDGVSLQGRRLLRFQPKLYAADHGFRECFWRGANERGIDQTLENIVCLELLRRGWQLRIGDAAGKEVDFVAERAGEKLYVQVSYLLASEATLAREFAPLLAIPDNWPKLVLTLDPVNRSRDGIRHQNIVDFLLEEER